MPNPNTFFKFVVQEREDKEVKVVEWLGSGGMTGEGWGGSCSGDSGGGSSFCF